MSADLCVVREQLGGVALVEPATAAGAEWLRANVSAPDWSWRGAAVAVDPRMLADLLAGAEADGLAVSLEPGPL